VVLIVAISGVLPERDAGLRRIEVNLVASQAITLMSPEKLCRSTEPERPKATVVSRVKSEPRL
jgi:hypothetical protein